MKVQEVKKIEQTMKYHSRDEGRGGGVMRKQQEKEKGGGGKRGRKRGKEKKKRKEDRDLRGGGWEKTDRKGQPKICA